MVIFISIMLCLFPIALIVYPLIKNKEKVDIYIGNDSYLQQRWDSLIEGLQNAELEFSIGTIDKDDYEWLQKTYTKEVVDLIKELKVTASEEEKIIQQINKTIKQIRS
ncbi:MAG: hypothetical protein CL882_04870 [Dehalococcoidia bacterium]|nr:hypothetical protein [Dehalococcoidia bacterium]|tara:strand:+ start:2568 stop:2891 length:324 start_codon:yes stop_codon:yes gene_type:complete